MKPFRIFFACFFTVMLYSCEPGDTNLRDNNNILPANNVNFTLELSRPTNANLRFNGGQLFLSRDRALGSLEGVYIFRASPSVFFAYDLAEPNHPLGSCDIEIDQNTGLPIINSQGRFVYDCNGQETLYDSLTGQRVGEGEGFSLRAYTVFPETNGDQVVSIRISG